MSIKRIFQVLSVFFVAFVFTNNAEAGGFGVSPPQIIADNLLKGSVYEQTVTFVQSEPDEDLQAEVVFDVSEIESWISIDKGMFFTIPKGEQQFPIKVKISVPENAPTGKYRGYIRVNTKPVAIVETGEGSSVNINYGGRIDLDLTVGNNVIEEFNIISIRIKDIENGWPFLATVKIQNTGNVPVKLDRATFDLFDKYNSVRLGYAQTEYFESVPPFSIRETWLKFPIDLRVGLGEYSAVVKVFKDGKIVKEEKESFRVVEEGTLDYSFGGIVKNDNKQMNFIKILSIAFLIFVLVIAVAVVIIRRKNKKKKVENEKEKPEVKEDNEKIIQSEEKSAKNIEKKNETEPEEKEE